MSSHQFQPPFARSRQIAREAIARKAEEAEARQKVEEPVNVSAALEKLEPEVVEPEPEVVEPEPEVVEPEPELEWNPDMRKSDLLEIALAMGLDLPDKPYKADIIKALEEAS